LIHERFTIIKHIYYHSNCVLLYTIFDSLSANESRGERERIKQQQVCVVVQ